MPTNIVPTLQQDKAYVFCPTCSREGTEKSPLMRDSHLLKCAFGHSFDSRQLAALRARGTPVEMENWTDLIVEQPPDYCEKFPIWCNPAVWKHLQKKFRGRFIATLITYLEALADDTIVLIDGADAEELRKMNLKNGVEILAAMRDRVNLQTQLDDANRKIEQFRALMSQAGVGL